MPKKRSKKFDESKYVLRVYITNDQFEKLEKLEGAHVWYDGEMALLEITHGEEILNIKINKQGNFALKRVLRQ